ncbi:hypothetical protein B0A48_16968 [Cryoendolithus antarcticus]|uniref:Protein kinase domain-containing protein n=1 Tax=Cryoendolithus antarcticus TaxID=1507870 RepID=A0A1V8SCT9_9PEZI|nr:hypothetical protein B0A48_16968 [Cryoendolithus antarcticus]
MSSSSVDAEQADLHVLDFFLDDVGSCALTAYSDLMHQRFHIIADVGKFRHSQKPAGISICEQYGQLVEACLNQENRSLSQPISERDSAVDVAGPDDADARTTKSRSSHEDAKDAIHEWMLAPLARGRDKTAASNYKPTVQEYYDADTRFFDLEIANSDHLIATELEATTDLKRRMAKLNPEISIPKYIRDLNYFWYSASDLEVLDGSSSPPPYHPTRVRVKSTGETFFFKAAVEEAPKVTKREITMLHRLAQPDIKDQVLAPQLVGLVGSGTSSTKALGFLQSEIADPVPLTSKLDVKVPQADRDRWAEEAERMKNVLHEHNLVWGDAKADNFIVDREGKLWLIDMGGSYTDGWIDPELADTAEGDDQGVEKVVNALHDPVNNTMSEEEDSQSATQVKEHSASPRPSKRKAIDVVGPVDTLSKRRKQDEDTDSDAETDIDSISDESSPGPATPARKTAAETDEQLYCLYASDPGWVVELKARRGLMAFFAWYYTAGKTPRARLMASIV